VRRSGGREEREDIASPPETYDIVSRSKASAKIAG